LAVLAVCSSRAKLLARFLKRIDFEVIHLQEFKPSKTKIEKCDEAAEETRLKIEALQGPQGNLRELLLARVKAKGLLGDYARQ
jgi:hypothetical protein